MVQFFKQEKEHKLDIDITVLTREASLISERLYLKKAHDLLRRGIVSKGKETREKIIVYVDTSWVLLSNFMLTNRRRPSISEDIKIDNVIDCGHVFLCKGSQEMGFRWTLYTIRREMCTQICFKLARSSGSGK